MQLNVIKNILTCFVFACIAMAAMLFLTKQSLSSGNYFVRYFPAHTYARSFTTDVRLNSFYVAGATQTHVYLANYTSSSSIVSFDQFAKDSTPHNFRFDKNTNLSQSYSTFIDSPFVFLFDGLSPQVVRGKLSDDIFQRVLITEVSFSSSFSIASDSNSFVMRKFNKALGRNIFISCALDNPKPKLFPNILEKQVDGLFCTDGILSFDKPSKRFLYTYFYRNEYILMDSNLAVISRAHTIDTTSIAKIKVASMTGERSTTFSAPPYFVNLFSSFSGNWLAVQSPVKATNESQETFTANSVLDFYTLADHKYRLSMYIPDIDHHKISNFKMLADKLYVIQGNYFTVYHLNLLTP